MIEKDHTNTNSSYEETPQTPYIDVSSLIWDGFGDASQADLEAMVRTGYIGFYWGADIFVSKIVPPK